MSGSTPGPWEVGLTNPYPDESDEIAILAATGNCVAVAIPKGMKDEAPEVTKANARLIAAAPDLLEAAKAHISKCTEDTWQALIAAIVKAETEDDTGQGGHAREEE